MRGNSRFRADTDLFLAVGAITGSQKMINRALEAQEKGDKMKMCKALEEWEQQCMEDGRKSGKVEGVIMAYLDMGVSKYDIIEKVKEKLNISEEEAIDYYNKFATV